MSVLWFVWCCVCVCPDVHSGWEATGTLDSLSTVGERFLTTSFKPLYLSYREMCTVSQVIHNMPPLLSFARCLGLREAREQHCTTGSCMAHAWHMVWKGGSVKRAMACLHVVVFQSTAHGHPH